MFDAPEALRELPAWADRHKVSMQEARGRFAQAAALRAIAGSAKLSSILVLKGGNALDFVWLPNRSTRDLDFSSHDAALDVDSLREMFTLALRPLAATSGISMRVHKVERQPPGLEKTRVTFAMKIGYALPDEKRQLARLAQGSAANVVPLDISINEPICAEELQEVGAANPLRVSTLEDIVAEKLRSLLQQPLRNRSRRQDLLDITTALTKGPPLDPVRVGRFLKIKAAAREVPVSVAAFRNPEIARRARVDYEELQSTTRNFFIEFDKAWRILIEFVEGLGLSVGDDR